MWKAKDSSIEEKRIEKNNWKHNLNSIENILQYFIYLGYKSNWKSYIKIINSSFHRSEKYKNIIIRCTIRLTQIFHSPFTYPYNLKHASRQIEHSYVTYTINTVSSYFVLLSSSNSKNPQIWCHQILQTVIQFLKIIFVAFFFGKHNNNYIWNDKV